MFLTTVLVLVLAFLCWLLFAPFELEADSRIPAIRFRWKTIASVNLCFDNNEWQLKVRAFFFHKQWSLYELIDRKKSKPNSKAKEAKKKKAVSFSKFLRVLRTCRIESWKISVDTGDYAVNALLFPLGYLPATINHLAVNFYGQNLFVCRITNAPWRIILAFIR